MIVTAGSSGLQTTPFESDMRKDFCEPRQSSDDRCSPRAGLPSSLALPRSVLAPIETYGTAIYSDVFAVQG